MTLGSYAGYWQVDFNYANNWDIEGKTEVLIARLYGDSAYAPDTGINWAYTTSSVDGSFLACCIVMALLIFAAGYLICCCYRQRFRPLHTGSSAVTASWTDSG